MDLNLDDVRDELDKNIERDIDSMYNLRRTESSSPFEFNEKKNVKDSLALIGNRFEIFEKIKKNWNKSHQRIKDFHHKKIQKYQQQFSLKYMYIFDVSNYTYQKKIRALSKYTFNLSNDVELDLGSSIFSKEDIGLSNMFVGLRFYAFNKKMFVNTYGCMGDNKYFFLEANYLFRHNILLDYTYKRNIFLNENVHHIFLNKIFRNDFQGSLGFKYKPDTNENFLSLSSKKYFGKNHCVNMKMDVGLDQLIINTKYKERISDNFFTINNTKIDINYVFPKFHFKNSIIYRLYNRNLRCGYFFDNDGYGLELGFNFGGLDVKLPLMIGSGLDINEYEYSHGMIRILKGVCIFLALNLVTSFILKGISSLFARKTYSKEKVEKKRAIVEDSRKYIKKINNNLYSQAEANHLAEIKKKNKGLIIHLALYGNKKRLKYIMNNFLYIKSDKIIKFVEDIDNEVLDVTVPTRYLLKRETDSNFSSIFFHQVPKTKIIGFTNPIFSSNKFPYLMIR